MPANRQFMDQTAESRYPFTDYSTMLGSSLVVPDGWCLDAVVCASPPDSLPFYIYALDGLTSPGGLKVLVAAATRAIIAEGVPNAARTAIFLYDGYGRAAGCLKTSPTAVDALQAAVNGRVERLSTDSMVFLPSRSFMFPASSLSAIGAGSVFRSGKVVLRAYDGLEFGGAVGGVELRASVTSGVNGSNGKINYVKTMNNLSGNIRLNAPPDSSVRVYPSPNGLVIEGVEDVV